MCPLRRCSRFRAIANDLNPVAWLILKATVEFPSRFRRGIYSIGSNRSRLIGCRVKPAMQPFFPADPDPDREDATFLWARTVHCPYCDGLVPLSPNWRLDSAGTGVKLIPQTAEPATATAPVIIPRAASTRRARSRAVMGCARSRLRAGYRRR